MEAVEAPAAPASEDSLAAPSLHVDVAAPPAAGQMLMSAFSAAPSPSEEDVPAAFKGCGMDRGPSPGINNNMKKI